MIGLFFSTLDADALKSSCSPSSHIVKAPPPITAQAEKVQDKPQNPAPCL